MKYYIIAGEASGDLHGARLIQSLKNFDSVADIRCWGGDLMQAQGTSLAKHIKELAFMGFVEILGHINTLRQNFKFCKQDILNYKPDVVIFIDYPGFNLRLAKFVKRNGFKTFYYISPQLWAWKKKRIDIIRRYIDKMFVILPFENEFYKLNGVDVIYEGHPLKDIVDEAINKENELKNLGKGKPIIAILPGSRKQEIEKQLPIMLLAQKYFPDYCFVVAGAPSISEEFYKNIVHNKSVEIIFNQTYNLLKLAKGALVTSGTATLETALFRVPQVVCYRSNYVSYWLAKQLIKVKFISLVNLIMDAQIVRELIQNQLNEDNIVAELNKILNDTDYRERMITNYNSLRDKLGETNMVDRIAKQMIEFS